MKFADVVTCVATLAVILVVVSFPLEMVLVPALGSDWGPYVNLAVSVLLSALIGGYIFAGKIWEARMEAIAKITVLAATLMIFYVICLPSLAHWNLTVKEAYEVANPGAILSSSEWLIVESMMLSQTVFIYVVMVLLLGFVGLYVGSSLRKPAKS